jgi:hypothetical protein
MTDDARQPTEEELRAAYEAEIKQIRIEQILLENIVTLVNMGMRKTGLIPGTEDERDPAQVQIAIEAVRAHLPLVDQIAPEQTQPIQDALAQLQLAYVQIGGGGGVSPLTPGAPAPAQPEPPKPPSRLWVPGQ